MTENGVNTITAIVLCMCGIALMLISASMVILVLR